MIYWQLFLAFLQIGAFSFGGGYAAMPLIEAQVVNQYGWLTPNEFVDIVTISQMTPGPIAINAATFVGQRVAGLGGALVATLGCILPSCILVLLIAHFYYKRPDMKLMQGVLYGLRPTVTALIAAAGVSILTLTAWPGGQPSWNLQDLDWIALVLFAVCLLILRKWKVGPILMMIGAGGLGLVLCLAGVPLPV